MKALLGNLKIAESLLRQNNPELFGLLTPRSRIQKYKGDNIWRDVANIEMEIIKDFCRAHVVSQGGKYYDIDNNTNWFLKQIKDTWMQKEDSPCHPQSFSESVIKPACRSSIKNFDNCLVSSVQNQVLEKLALHIKERLNQQLKADYSEYLLFSLDDRIIPRLTHQKGIDMFLLNNGIVESLNIKTSRSTNLIEDPKKAIIYLYENQGKDRFESKPRLYLIMNSQKNMAGKDEIKKQLDEKYNVSFKWEGKTFSVEGCRIIFL